MECAMISVGCSFVKRSDVLCFRNRGLYRGHGFPRSDFATNQESAF